jgi:hypothetical protein
MLPGNAAGQCCRAMLPGNALGYLKSETKNFCEHFWVNKSLRMMWIQQYMYFIIGNLRGTNGDRDHDQDMLDEIYHAIRNEEIVMPAEHTGLLKENYLWKCVLKRGQEGGSQGRLLLPSVMFDHDLFCIVWGPAVAALSYVFDKSRINEGGAEMIERSLNGFQRCAAIAAHYRMCDVFDNIVSRTFLLNVKMSKNVNKNKKKMSKKMSKKKKT